MQKIKKKCKKKKKKRRREGREGGVAGVDQRFGLRPRGWGPIRFALLSLWTPLTPRRRPSVSGLILTVLHLLPCPGPVDPVSTRDPRHRRDARTNRSHKVLFPVWVESRKDPSQLVTRAQERSVNPAALAVFFYFFILSLHVCDFQTFKNVQCVSSGAKVLHLSLNSFQDRRRSRFSDDKNKNI